jgi:hypothetical protein
MSIVDVVVEIELAFGHRHHAGVSPVGDVDVGMRQHRLDGAAQQRRIVARHWRHDQKLGVGTAAGGQGALEMDQVAEWPRPGDLLGHTNRLEVDRRLFEAEGRLAIAPRRALEEFGHRRH